jgi:hypothetical protein
MRLVGRGISTDQMICSSCPVSLVIVMVKLPGSREEKYNVISPELSDIAIILGEAVESSGVNFNPPPSTLAIILTLAVVVFEVVKVKMISPIARELFQSPASRVRSPGITSYEKVGVGDALVLVEVDELEELVVEFAEEEVVELVVDDELVVEVELPGSVEDELVVEVELPGSVEVVDELVVDVLDVEVLDVEEEEDEVDDSEEVAVDESEEVVDIKVKGGSDEVVDVVVLFDR